MQQAIVFHALGDQTRLTIMTRLAKDRYLTITEVSAGLAITRQGVRRHLEVLANANLVHLEPNGRDVLVSANGAVLEQAKRYLAKLEQQWDRRLNALKNFVEL